jgi:TonB-linked SusC/RagA family outer membrane protein
LLKVCDMTNFRCKFSVLLLTNYLKPHNMRKLLQSLFILMCIAATAFAQERTITGIVTSKDDGLPIPSVGIKLKGTTTSTLTTSNGSYSIKVSNGNNAVLVFSYVGYATQEVAVGSRSTVNVTIVGDDNQLSEVLVVAYGKANKATFTGSTAQINSAEFEKRPITNVLNAIAGSAPGIQASTASGAPGSSPSIRIRGFGSVNASNDALFVVDGAVYDGNIANIDPEDVASVSLLKDASTAALYGSRAGNGVVMITTKKGRKGKDNLQFKASAGIISRGLPEYERLTAEQYYPKMWETYRNTLQYGSLAIPRDVANSIASGLTPTYNNANYSGIKTLLGYNPFNVADNAIVGVDGTLNPNASLLYGDDLDWADQAAQGGKSRQSYSLAYSGGTDKSDYYTSLGYTNEKGYLIASNLKRYNGRINVNTKPTKWFSTGFNLAGNYTQAMFANVSADGQTSIINPFYISRFMGPIYPVHLRDATTGALVLDANGQSQYDIGALRPFASGRNVIFENLNDTQNTARGALNGRTYATVNILPGLTGTANVAFDFQDTQQREYDNTLVGDGAPSGRAYQYSFRTTTVTLSQILDYTKNIGKHNFNVIAGHENYNFKYNYLSGSRSGQIVQGISELTNFSTVLGTTSYERNARIDSYLSRLSYDFDGKYLLSGSLRRDGNSKFGNSVRWENFWSVGAGWNLHRESFFKADWVDQLKLRASYGVLGNDGVLNSDNNTDYFPYQALYQLGINNQTSAGIIQQSLGNQNLTWETSKNFDAGIDYSLLKGRLSGSVEYFKRTTDGLIFNVQSPLSVGGTPADGNFEVATNIGSVYNKGVELSVTGQIVKSRDFTYSATVNLTHLKNQITKMPDNLPLIQTTGIGTKGLSVGHSVYDFYLREYYGVDPDNGRALYKTNAMTANARVIGTDTVTNVIGEANYRYTGDSAIPDLTGSLLQSFGYKNFTLNLNFSFQTGGKVYDSAYAALMHGGTYGTAMHVDALNAWKNPGEVTDVPRLDNSQVPNQSGASSRWLTSASYFQINNITLNYNLPKTWMQKIGAERASIYVSGDNLAVAAARKGMGASTSFNGTVGNNYNFSRTISLGASVNF